MTTRLTLDAGALIGFDRNDRSCVALLATAIRNEVELVVPAGVVGQVWRNGRTQGRLAKLLASRLVEVEPLDDTRARQAGQLCGLRGTSDVIDASVVLCAVHHQGPIATTDADDLRHLDADARLIE